MSIVRLVSAYMYCTAQFATEGWSGRDMSNVIVKENESLDSALRRFKAVLKAGIQQEIRKRERKTVDVRKSLKQLRKRKFN